MSKLDSVTLSLATSFGTVVLSSVIDEADVLVLSILVLLATMFVKDAGLRALLFNVGLAMLTTSIALIIKRIVEESGAPKFDALKLVAPKVM